MFVKPVRIIIAFYLIVSFISCVNKESDTQQHIPDKHQNSGEISDQVLRKLSPEKATAKFGKPLTNASFNLSQPLSEFRIEIYNQIPERDRHSAEIKIKEYTWSYRKDRNLTIWYQLKKDKQVFLHYNIWPKGATF